MRDIVQNHVMQVLCLTAMEPPVTFDAESVREEKVKVLKAVRPIPEDEVENYAVRGQYERAGCGVKRSPATARRRTSTPGSVTETFVALKVFVDNWRWARVLSTSGPASGFRRRRRRSPSSSTPHRIPLAHDDDTEGLAPNVLWPCPNPAR